MSVLFIVLATLIVLGLLSYATYLLYLLRQQKQKQLQDKIQSELKQNKMSQEQVESLRIITAAMCAHQCEIAEGTIRIAYLLQKEPHETLKKANYPALHELYEKIKHQPIGVSRKDYKRQEIMRFDIERMTLEASYQDRILTEAEALKSLCVSIQSKVA